MSSLFTSYPAVSSHSIQCSDESRVLAVDARAMKFSPIEYRLLKLLLEEQPVPILDRDLVQAGFSCRMNSSSRENLDKHIDKIRSKLRPSGLNIHRVTGYDMFYLRILIDLATSYCSI